MLQELKPVLPTNYLSSIHTQLQKSFPSNDTINKHTIYDAFRGKLKDENKLSKIFQAASTVIQHSVNQQRKAQKQLVAIKKMKIASVVIFFALYLISF